jgi:hypothetical protein
MTDDGSGARKKSNGNSSHEEIENPKIICLEAMDENRIERVVVHPDIS